MSSRTVTRDLEVVAEGDFGSLQIFSSPSNIDQASYGPYLVKFTLKPGRSILNRTGLHWHERHHEYLKVTSGKAFVTIDGKTSIIDSNDGEICILKGVVHEWGVVDDIDNDQELIIWERTEPDDGQKELFFRNLISSLIDSSIGNQFSSNTNNRRLSIKDILQLFLIFRCLDNYPVIWNGFGRRYLTYSILNIAHFIGNFIFGLKDIYIEYTPLHLWNQYKLKYQ